MPFIGRDGTTAFLPATVNTSSSLTISNEGDLVVDTSDLFVDSSANKVGIGTQTPALRAHIYSTENADAALIESTQNFATLRFKSATNTSGPTVGIDGAGGLQLDQKDTNKYIAFAIGSERLRILNDGKVRVPDDGMFVAGAGDDLQIFHNGTHNFIDSSGSADLYVRGANILLQDHVNSNRNWLIGLANGTLELYHSGNKKLETTSTGVSVTGNIDVSNHINLLGDLDMGDSDFIRLGAGDDLLIYHDGNNSAINDVGEGNLFIQGSDSIYFRDYDTSENHMVMNKDGSVDLYYNGQKRFETEANGAKVTGILDVTSDFKVGAATNILLGGTALPSATGILGGSLGGTLSSVTMAYLASAPNNPVQGQFYFNSLSSKAQIYTGSSFVDLVPSGGGGGGGGGGGSSTDAQATLRKYTYSVSSTTNSVSGAADGVTDAGAFVTGRKYQIKTVGNTDFTAVGSGDNNVGTIFTATGAGSGTGDAFDVLVYVTNGSQNVEVYVNGVKAVEGATNDYVATSGTSVNFVANLASGDVVDVVVYELLTNDAFVLASGGTFTGNVGINTTSINNRFHIHSNANEQGILLTQAGNNYSVIYSDANRTGASNHLLAIEGHWNGTPVAEIALQTGSDTTNKDDGQIIFRTASASNLNNSERLRIDPIGRVLIGSNSGTKNITLKLQGHSGSATQDAKLRLCRGSNNPNNGNQLGAIFFSDNSETPSAEIIAFRDGATWSGSSKPGGLKFNTTPDTSTTITERLRIDSSGRIKIGPIADHTAAQTHCPVYIDVHTDVTAFNTAEGAANTGLVRIEETGSNNDRYHGIELRNRNSGDIRIMNLDRGTSDRGDLVIAMPDAGASTGLHYKMRFDSVAGSVRIAGKGGAGLANNAVESTDIYISTKSGLTTINTGAGAEVAGVIRFEDKGGNDNRYHGLELRNRNSGDLRIFNLDEGTVNKSNLVIGVDDGSAVVERLRITSGGNLIHGGVSNPAGYNLVTGGPNYYSLLVGSTTGGTAALVLDGAANGDGSGSDYASIEHNAGGEMRYKNRQSSSSGGAGHVWYTTNSDTEQFRINSVGNVSIGGKSNPLWNSTVDALTVGYAGVLYEDSYSDGGVAGSDNYVILGNNIFYAGSGGNKYIRNDEASRIMMQAGTFYFQSASSGTAGNAITFVDKLRIQSDRIRIYGESNYFTDIIGNSQTVTSGVRDAGCRFIGPDSRRMYFEILGNDVTDHIRFITSPSGDKALDYVAMHIGNNGNVGIGEIDPANRLVVQKVNANGDVGVRVKNDTTTDGSASTPTTASLYLTTSTGDFNTCYIQARRHDGDTHFGYADPRASGHVPNMVISNDGMVTKPKNVAFSYRRGGSLGSWGSDSGLTYPSLAYRTPLPLFGSGSADYDTQSSLSTFSIGGGTGMKFTAPVAGKYMIVLNMTSVRCHVQADWGSIGLMVNTTATYGSGSLDYMLDTKYTPDQSNSGTDQFGWGGSCIINLAANDYVVPYTMSCQHWSSDNQITFQGYLLG